MVRFMAYGLHQADSKQSRGTLEPKAFFLDAGL